MKRDNIVEFKETVELFITDTIPYLKNNLEVPNINFIFQEEAFSLFNVVMNFPFEIPNNWTPNIREKDIDNLRKTNILDNDLPAIIVHDYNLFFKYLTDITNSFIILHKKYNIDYHARIKHIHLLRKLWLRMGPSDFNQIEIFLNNQLLFLQENVLDNYKENTKIDTYYNYNIIAQAKLNNICDESTRCMSFKIYDNSNNYHSLPNIYYDILNTDTESICYIYAIQNDRKRRRIPKIERLLYKLNKSVLEEESQEYIDYLNKTSDYYPENISDVHPSQVLSLISFIKILKQNNITKIRVPVLQVLSYDYHINLSNEMKIDFKETWTKEALEDLNNATGSRKKWLEEDYLHDKEWYEHIVDKEDFISKNKTEVLIRIFRRACFHDQELEICNEPLLQGDYLDIRLNKGKIRTRRY